MAFAAERPSPPIGVTNDWQEAYLNGSFSIDTLRPSLLVESCAHAIRPTSRIADVGCGNGRNALFMADRGHAVDAFDLVDLGWLTDVDPVVASRIYFAPAAAEELSLLAGGYGGGVMAMRLLQYLPPTEVNVLLTKIAGSLERSGILLLSYSVSGGIHDTPEVDVKKYRHEPEAIIELLQQNGLAIVAARSLDTAQQHVPYARSLQACEIVAAKPSAI
jgi:SAM-dependent methyltransferase